MADESLNFRAFGEDVSAGRMFGNLADKADDAKNSIHDLGGESKDLDTRLEETRQHLRALIDDFEKTGDTSLFRDIRRDRSHISMIESLRKELHGVEDEAKTEFKKIAEDGVGAFSQGLTETFSNLPWAAIVGGAGLAALLAPVIGAAVGGAVLGGAGIGGIVGGVIAAAQDERIKNAGAELSQHFIGGFAAAGRVFINPILDQMLVLQHTEDVVLSDLASGFASLAPVIKPVAEGLDGLVENLNLDSVFADAVPAVRAIAQELPEIGSAIGDALAAIGDGSDGAIEGLVGLLQATEDIIRGTGEFIGFLSDAFDWLVRVNNAFATVGDNALNSFSWLEKIPVAGDALSLLHGYIHDTADETYSLIDGTHKAKDAGDDWSGSLAEQARSTSEAAKELQDYTDALEKLFGIQMSLDQAQIRYQQSIDDTLEALKKGKKTLDINTQDGRDHEKAVLAEIDAIEKLRQANIENGQSVEDANKIADGQIETLRTTLIRLGYNKQAVHDLVDAYIALKRNAFVSTHVDDKSVQIAYNHLTAVEKKINEIDGSVATVTVRTKFTGGKGGGLSVDPNENRASGGPVRSGQTYMVGENGPEIVTFGANGYVHDAASTRSMLSGASGGSVSVSLSIDPSGARDELAALFLKMLRVDAGFRASVASYVGV